MLKKLTITGAVAACIAIGAAGCGEDSATLAPAPETTKAEFIDQGNEILCAKTGAVEEAMAEVDLQSASDSELENLVLEGVLPAVRTAHSDLAALAARPDDEAEIEAMLKTLGTAIDATERDPAQLLTGPDPFARADALITDLGLSGCAV